MKGFCASRGPRSRTATFLVRVSLFSGLCLGVMVGGATAASAAEHAHADKPSVSQSASASSESDPGEKKPSGSEAKSSRNAKPTGKSSKLAEKTSQPKAESDDEAPRPEQVRPDEPAKPAKAQPEKPAEAEPAKPEKPAKPEVSAPAEPETDALGSGDKPAQAEANSSSHANAASEQDQDRPTKATGARHHAPAVAHGQPKAPAPDLLGTSVARQAVKVSGRSTARDDAQPRAPDAERTPDVEPPSSPRPAVPAPCAPPPGSLTSASAGSIGGLRNAHAILPGSPDLSDTAATVVAQRDIGPDISIRSVETTASPD